MHANCLLSRVSLNSLPNEKILDWSKLKTCAEDKFNMTENLKFVFLRLENILGKAENAGYQYFLLFPQCFQNGFSVGDR